MSKKNIFLILTIIFLILDVVLALVVFKPSVFKISKLAEEKPFLKPAEEEKQIKVSEDKSGNTLSVNAEQVGRYEKFEISLKPSKVYANPFDPTVVDAQAHFIAPSGKEEIAYGFWYQDYTVKTETTQRTKEGRSKTVTQEVYEPKGQPLWMFRYSPLEVGEYQYYLTIKEGQQGESRYPASGYLTFKAVASNSKGYIKVSQKNPEFFEYQDGTIFYGVGEGYDLTKESLKREYQSGMNWVQDEFTPGVMLEDKTIGQYSLERAFLNDELLSLAENYGIYFQVVLNHWSALREDMDSVGESLKGFEARYFRPWPENVYNAKNGGPLTNPVDYFSNETAKKYFKQRVRYFIARWGYSPNILAWQFWGEYDNVILFGEHLIRLPLVKAWHSEMSEYIKSLDSKHLVTSNEALPNNDSTVDDEIWQMNSIDYVTIHSYSDTNIDWVIPKAVASYSRYNKPLVVQEWGYIAEDLANKNPEANNVSWHNVIWQLSFMTAGTPMKFSYRDLTTDYQKIRSILAELWQGQESVSRLAVIDLSPKQDIEPITQPKRTGEIVTVREGGYISPVKIYGIGGASKAVLWIHDLRYTSMEIDRMQYSAQPMNGIKFQLTNMMNVNYQVEFIDTWTGDIVSTIEVQSSNGSLTIEVPDFTKDIAVKIITK